LPEVRVDALTGLRTIVAADRATRPGAGLRVDPPPPIDPADDPFAAGNEGRTPPELWAVRPGGGEPNSPGWTVRAVPNMYPALAADAPVPPPDAHADLFFAEPAVGAHEVIVNGPQPVPSLSALPVEQVERALDAWRARIAFHAEAAGYVHLIVNERSEAGASLPHTHAQLYALPFVPAAVARERERFGAYAARTLGQNLLEDVVQEEVRRRERLVAYDDDAVLLAPYGGRVPYQLMLVPRVPRARFEDPGALGAQLLHDGLARLARRLGASPPLNLWVRTAPRGADHFCWRIDVLPRLAQLAGLELGTGLHLNVVAPERAAAELREA
jgi:UDPglucose--hexose-1-phosphate uridylyltransferase